MSSLWRYREFLKFWAGSAISDVGSQVTALAVPLIAVLTLDATPWQMGLLSAAGGAPILLVGLFAGVWVDRVRRRPVMIATDLGRAALLLIVPLAAVAGVLRIEILYAVLLLSGALTVLFDVAHLSFVPSLVTPDRLVEGNSKLESTSAAAQVAGPSVGGVLVSLLTAPFALLVDALSFLVSRPSSPARAWTRPRPRRAADVRASSGRSPRGCAWWSTTVSSARSLALRRPRSCSVTCSWRCRCST